MAAIMNSVPWRSCHLTSGVPKPTEKRRTFTPQRRATQKCPNSWKVTSTPSATRVPNSMYSPLTADPPLRTFASWLATVTLDPLRGKNACLPVDRQHRLQRIDRQHGDVAQHRLNQVSDGGEADALLQEGSHRHLICRIQHHRSGAASLGSLAGQAQ